MDNRIHSEHTGSSDALPPETLHDALPAEPFSGDGDEPAPAVLPPVDEDELDEELSPLTPPTPHDS